MAYEATPWGNAAAAAAGPGTKARATRAPEIIARSERRTIARQRMPKRPLLPGVFCDLEILGLLGALGPLRVAPRMEETANRTVVIVDDDEDIRDALRLLFELEDFEVVGEAANGLDAIPLVLQERPQVIVIDYLMPLMNGATLAQVVRGISPDTKIVAFSAVLDTEPAWADAYLSKERINDVAPLITALIPSARSLDQAQA